MKKWNVTLSRVEYLSATVEVEAETEEEAREKALDEAPDWSCKDADQQVEDVTELP